MYLTLHSVTFCIAFIWFNKQSAAKLGWNAPREPGGRDRMSLWVTDLLHVCEHRLEDKTLGNKERACILTYTYIHGQEERTTVAEDFSQWRTLCCFPPPRDVDTRRCIGCRGIFYFFSIHPLPYKQRKWLSPHASIIPFFLRFRNVL